MQPGAEPYKSANVVSFLRSPTCEEALGEGTGATIRVILEGEAPEGPCLVDGAPAEHTVLVARAY